MDQIAASPLERNEAVAFCAVYDPWVPSGARPFLTMEEIAVAICARSQVALRELTGPWVDRRVARPRQEFMYRAYVQRRWSTTQIGDWLGGRHHSTVIHGVRAHAARSGLPSPLKVDRRW